MAFFFVVSGQVDELTQHSLWNYGCQGIEELAEGMRAYFAEKVVLSEKLEQRGQWQDVPDIDWMAKYYQELQPIYLKKLIVTPSHHQVEAKQRQKVIRLDPGMAFGTGHHGTTYLALQTLERIPLIGTRVLDVGTGSGILAIAASLLAAAQVDAIDNDPLTLPVAENNIEHNTNHPNIYLRCGTLDASVPTDSYDVVVANLFAELHVEFAEAYARVLKLRGTLIITGILDTRLSFVSDALAPFFDNITIQRRNEWVLVQASRL